MAFGAQKRSDPVKIPPIATADETAATDRFWADPSDRRDAPGPIGAPMGAPAVPNQAVGNTSPNVTPFSGSMAGTNVKPIGAGEPRTSVIGNDLTISGEKLHIESKGALRIDGDISGDVSAAALEIGPRGSVSGSVAADKVHVEGQVSGQIHARTVALKSSATVDSDIHYDTIEIEQGAQFNGRARPAKSSDMGAHNDADDGSLHAQAPIEAA